MSLCSTFALAHVPLILAFFAPTIRHFSVLTRMQCFSCNTIFGFWHHNSAYIALLCVLFNILINKLVIRLHIKLFGLTC